jgi:hypothetical protein
MALRPQADRIEGCGKVLVHDLPLPVDTAQVLAHARPAALNVTVLILVVSSLK